MSDRWKRLAPLSGVVMVGLVVALLNVSGNTPSASSSGTKVLTYYGSHVGRQHAAVVLAAYAALFGLVYFVSVSRFLRSRGANALAETTVAGAVLYAGGLTLAAGSSAILSDHVKSLSPGAAQALNLVQTDLWWPMMMVGFALATLVMAGFVYQRLGAPTTITMPDVPGQRADADTQAAVDTAAAT